MFARSLFTDSPGDQTKFWLRCFITRSFKAQQRHVINNVNRRIEIAIVCSAASCRNRISHLHISYCNLCFHRHLIGLRNTGTTRTSISPSIRRLLCKHRRSRNCNTCFRDDEVYHLYAFVCGIESSIMCVLFLFNVSLVHCLALYIRYLSGVEYVCVFF